MDLDKDLKEKLNIASSRTSFFEESDSIGVYDLDSEDGRKSDSNSDDLLSKEDELEDVKMNAKKNFISNENDTKFLSHEEAFYNSSVFGKDTPEGALERAATLAEGIRTLGKSQEDNWKKMHDLIMKKDSLIKQMADVMISCKTRMSPSNESLRRGVRKQNFSSCGLCTNTHLIPEKDLNDLWDPDDSFSALGDVSADDISEVSLDEFSDGPILEVPYGFGDHDSGMENNVIGKEIENVQSCIASQSENDI
ncbi:Protein of unknown function [Gryllus bimaculatus]|nr:Protein of unknown function [Gryllus bimaculatus]